MNHSKLLHLITTQLHKNATSPADAKLRFRISPQFLQNGHKIKREEIYFLDIKLFLP